MLVWLSQIGSSPQYTEGPAVLVLVDGCLRVEIGVLDGRERIGLRIEHRHHVRALLRRAVDRAVGIHLLPVLLACDRIMQILTLEPPIPHADDDVALDPLRPLWLCERQFARSDAIGPVRIILDGLVRSDTRDRDSHIGHCLAGLKSALPRLPGVLEAPKLGRERAHALGAKRMTRLAGVLDRCRSRRPAF